MTKRVHEVIVGEGNDGDIQSIVHFVLMLGKRCFTVNEMPPEAVNLWRVSYLLAEVLNGGLAHYISNTGWSPALDHYFERATAPDCFCCLLPPPADAGVRELIAAAAMTMANSAMRSSCLPSAIGTVAEIPEVCSG